MSAELREVARILELIQHRHHNHHGQMDRTLRECATERDATLALSILKPLLRKDTSCQPNT